MWGSVLTFDSLHRRYFFTMGEQTNVAVLLSWMQSEAWPSCCEISIGGM